MRGAAVMVDKPSFTIDQMNNLTDVSRKFSELRRKARTEPQAILNNGSPELVVLDYVAFERLFMRVQELEDLLEDQIVSERISVLEKDPSIAVPFAKVAEMFGYKG